MPTTSVYLSAAAALFAISVLFLIASIQNSVDEKSILATPNIPVTDGIMTSFASTRIRGSVDEVFNVLLKFDHYEDWSPFTEYKWDAVTADGLPMTGSTGTFKFSIDEFITRTLHVKLTVLDRQSKRLAECTTHYPRWLLGSERVQEVVPVEGQKGVCEYRTWQTLEGVAAYYLLLTSKDDLMESHKKCAEGLKSLVEGRRR